MSSLSMQNLRNPGFFVVLIPEYRNRREMKKKTSGMLCLMCFNGHLV